MGLWCNPSLPFVTPDGEVTPAPESRLDYGLQQPAPYEAHHANGHLPAPLVLPLTPENNEDELEAVQAAEVRNSPRLCIQVH